MDFKNPFKFLSAYTVDDKNVFFGRDEEIEALYQLVFKTPLVLVYGLSGTGKTSLIQCGLAGQFDGPEWFPFFVRREENINTSLTQSLQQALRTRTADNAVDAIDYLSRKYMRPVYLIFDQFEELLIMGKEEEQVQFMETLQALIAADLDCKILLIMREEYLGQLYAYEKIVPSLLDFRLRVERMSASKIRNVITQSFAEFNITLAEPQDDLLDVIIENLTDPKSGVVSLPYLQVYLYMLYNEDFKRAYPNGPPEGGGWPPLTFSQKEIKAFGRIESVLERFLAQQVNTINKSIRTKYKDVPKDVVSRILDGFVTPDGTKRPVNYTRVGGSIALSSGVQEFFPAIAAEPFTEIIDALDASRILRVRESEDQESSIEIAHDSLALLIDQQRSIQQRQLNNVRRRLTNAYDEYSEFKNDEQLLTEQQLVRFDPYLEQLRPSEDILKFVQASRSHIEKKKASELKRVRRRTQWVALALFAVLAGAAIWLSLRRDAKLADQRAQEAEQQLDDMNHSFALFSESVRQLEGWAPDAEDPELESIIDDMHDALGVINSSIDEQEEIVEESKAQADEAPEATVGGDTTGVAAAPRSITITRAQTTSGLDDSKNPVDAQSSFAPGTKVFLWAEMDVKKDTRVKLVWYSPDNQTKENVYLLKADPAYRIWTWKRFGLKGDFRAVLFDSDENSLGEVRFKVE